MLIYFFPLKQQKFFDSGDYNMAKAAVTKELSTISTQPAVAPALPLAIISSMTNSVANRYNISSSSSPDYLPIRKPSIHVQSKLATGS